MKLSQEEEVLYWKFKDLKSGMGTHAPSVYSLLNEFPEVRINIDACFLCNPYAFDLFNSYLKREDLENYLKFYPPQNKEIAANISKYNKVPLDNILVGNGAIEIIESLFKYFSNQKVLIPIPTFSTYYEAANKRNSVVYFELLKEDGFEFNIEKLVESVLIEKPKIVAIVNPNNPTGSYIKSDDICKLHKALSEDQLLIIDESFIDFHFDCKSIEEYAVNNQNIIVIRSLSKDFGVAGVRVGYAVLSKKLRAELLKDGFLWNSNGIAYLFSLFLANPEFQNEYQIAKAKYNNAKITFKRELDKLAGVRIYSSFTNFFLIELNYDPYIFFTKLLFQFGIYTRVLDDRIGLKGNFIRLASKNSAENSEILFAIKNIK